MVEGKASYKVAKKLKMLKVVIKNWVKQERVKGEEGINELMEELGELDRLDREGGRCREDGEKREMLRVDLANKLCMEEIFWRQKAREKCLKEWDHNTKYFRCLTNFRRPCNFVDELSIDN